MAFFFGLKALWGGLPYTPSRTIRNLLGRLHVDRVFVCYLFEDLVVTRS